MIAWLNPHCVLLANGEWKELIGIAVVFGFYLIGAIAKIWSNRSQSGDEDESETSPAVEMARKYLKQSGKKADKPLSEWDRRQEMKRQRVARMREQEKPPHPIQPQPAKIKVVSESPKPRVNVIRPPQKYSEISQPTRVRQVAVKKEVKPVAPAMKAVVVPSKPEEHQKKPAETTVKTAYSLDVFLKHPGDLRSAIILKEILDKPVALRDAF